MLYILLKFIHIAAAIIWIGSIFTISVLNITMAKKRDLSGIISLAKQGEVFGKFIIGPAGFVTLFAGIAVVEVVGYDWDFWIIWGFIVIILTVILGGTMGRKTGKKLADVAASDEVDDLLFHSLKRKLTLLSTITLLLLFSAVWVMVYKPTL